MGKAKELTTFQKVVAIITVASLTVYSVVNIALVANAYAKLDDNVSELGDIIDNWQTFSLKNIQVVTTSSCPAGYEAFTQRSWAGTSQGCFCGSVSASTLASKNITCSPFCSGECSTTAASVGCTNVSPQSSVAFKFFGKDASNNNQICVQRTQDTLAKSSSVISSSGECPSGYFKCGTDDYAFCVSGGSSSSDCPITSITINNVTSGDIASCSGANCLVLSNTAGDYRTITIGRNEASKMPLAEFKVDEWGSCKLTDEINATPNRELFYLLNSKPSTCDKEGDYKWNTLDTINEANLFSYNSITSSITYLSNYDTSTMDGYYPIGKTGANYVWKIFSKNYIPWKSSCRDRMQSLIDKKAFVDNMKTSQLALLVIAIISSLFLGVVLGVMEIQNLRGVDLSCIDGKGEEERTKLKRFKKFVNYGFKGVQLPFQIWAIVVTGSAKSLLTNVANDSCSNDDTNAILVFIAKTTNSTFSSTLSALGILVATVILDIILEVWEKRKAKKEADKASISPGPKEEKLELAHIEDANSASQSSSPLRFSSPAAPQTQMQPQSQFQSQPQPQAQPSITIQIGGGPQSNAGFPPQQQQQYPPQQYPPQQYPPQQYPPQQYPPQQYPPQQYPPQQYPPQQYPQQQYPPRY